MCDRWARYAELMRLGEEALLLSMLRPTDADRPDGPFKTTVAHLAAEHGNVPLLRELHRMGVSLNRVSALGDTVAHFAARGGHTKLLQLLVSIEPEAVLRVTREAGGEEGLSLGVHVLGARRPDGELPLTIAASRGHTEAAIVLAEAAAADRDADDAAHNVAVMVPPPLGGHADGAHSEEGSAAAAYAEAAKSYKAHHKHRKAKKGEPDPWWRLSLDATNGNGSSAAHLAAARGNVELLRALHRCGADLGMPNAKYGMTPLDWALEAEEFEAAAFLESAGFVKSPPPPPQPVLPPPAKGKKGKKGKGKKKK
jgi:ankyrin repeat protein